MTSINCLNNLKFKDKVLKKRNLTRNFIILQVLEIMLTALSCSVFSQVLLPESLAFYLKNITQWVIPENFHSAGGILEFRGGGRGGTWTGILKTWWIGGGMQFGIPNA